MNAIPGIYHEAILKLAIMAYYRPSYDDYFVESYDDRGRTFRQKAKLDEHQRNREIQLAIAEELSQQASEEYRDDILSHMEQMEVSGPSPKEPIGAKHQ